MLLPSKSALTPFRWHWAGGCSAGPMWRHRPSLMKADVTLVIRQAGDDALALVLAGGCPARAIRASVASANPQQPASSPTTDRCPRPLTVPRGRGPHPRDGSPTLMVTGGMGRWQVPMAGVVLQCLGEDATGSCPMICKTPCSSRRLGLREEAASPVALGQSPTVRRRELGALLRELRKGSGFTVEDVADRLLCSATKVSRMETGHRGATLRDVRDLCNLYGVDDAKRERLMSLARQSRERSWWQEVDHQLSAPYSTYIGLETAAVSIRDYESGVVPGLLQTEDYARAMIRGNTLPRATPEVVDELVATRMTRQHILRGDDAPRLWAVLDEAVLHRRVGGAEVMRAQIERIIKDSELPNVTVQILPYDIGSHPGLDSTFIILEFAEPAVSNAVYVEGLVGQIYLERPQDVERYTHTFDHLRAMALSPADSLDLMGRACEEFAEQT